MAHQVRRQLSIPGNTFCGRKKAVFLPQRMCLRGPGPRAWSSENGDSAWKAVMRGWRVRGKGVHHPSPPEETTNGSPASRPAVGRVAKEDKPLPRLSKVPKSFQNSDPGAGSQARWSPRGAESGPSVSLGGSALLPHQCLSLQTASCPTGLPSPGPLGA